MCSAQKCIKVEKNILYMFNLMHLKSHQTTFFFFFIIYIQQSFIIYVYHIMKIAMHFKEQTQTYDTFISKAFTDSKNFIALSRFRKKTTTIEMEIN